MIKANLKPEPSFLPWVLSTARSSSTGILKIVREFQSMAEAERAAIEKQSLALAGDGRFELFTKPT